MLKARYVWTGVLVAVAASVATVVYLNRSESVFLTTKGSVPVYATLEESRSPSSPTIAVIEPKQKMPVLNCIDVKEYEVYKVRLADGKVGYVNIGTYELTDKDSDLVTFC
jgi:hypothetical protein